MKLSFVVQTDEVPVTVPVALLSGSFEEKAAKAAALGAGGLELMTLDPASLSVGDLRRSLTRQGLQVAAVASGALSFAGGITLLHREPEVAALARRRLAELIHLAAALEAPVVTIGSFRGRVGAIASGGRELLVERLREGATLAETAGVRLALEPVNRYESDIVNTAAQAIELVREIGHPALGLLLDTYHVNIEERSWTEPFTRLTREGLLWHVHLGDNNRLPPGQGLIDFAAIVAALRQAGYCGYLSAELLASPDADTAARQTAEHMLPLI